MPGIREELELDVSGALKSIDQIDSALGDTVQGFKASLLDAISVLSSISIEADVSGLEASLASVGTDTIVVDADVSPAESEIAGLSAEQLTLFPDADTSAAAAEIQGLEAEPIVVPVEADTTAAQQSLGDLGNEASGASSGLVDLTAATTAFNVAGGAAVGNASGLTGALAKAGPEGAAAAAGVGAVAGAADLLFGKALAAEAATQRFNSTLGEFAGTVQHIQVGNLDADLSDLNRSLGSSPAAAKQAAASLFNLGIANGTAAREVAQTTAQVQALAARAVALNPSLGSVADVANRLTTGLARGGRFAAQFGVSLSTAEISARALADTGKTTAADLTIYEKAAAGAELATQKYGDTLDQVITKGTENPQIKLAALGAEFNKFLTELGKPLVSPVFTLLERAIPVAAGLAGVLGSVAGALIPLASALLLVANGLTPIESALSATFGLLGDGITLITGFVGSLGPTVPILAGVYAGLVLLNVGLTLIEAHPIIAFFTSLVLIAGAVQRALGKASDSAHAFDQIFSEVTAQSDAIDQGLLRNAHSVSELKDALNGSLDSFGQFVATQSEFSKNAEAGTALRKTGEDLATLRTQLEGGETGFRDFAIAAVKAGTATIEVNGRTNASIDEQVSTLQSLDQVQATVFANNGKGIVQGKALFEAFNRQQLATEQLSQAKINELALSGQVSQSQIDQAGAAVQAAGGTFTYAKELRALVELAPAVVGTDAAITAAVQAQNQSYIDLAASLSTAQQQNQQIITGQNAVADSTIALSSAQRAVASLPRQIAAANREQTSAQRDLATAQQALGDLNRQYLSDLNAQKSAVFGLVDAQRALRDAQRQPAKDANALASAQLDVQSSQLALTDSQKKLNDLRADPSASAEDIAKAEIELQRAQLDVSNSTIRVADVQEQASLQGENLAKAQLGVSNAQLAVDSANQKVADHAAAVAAANDAIAAASDRVAEAADNAAAAIEGQQKAYENYALAVLNNASAIKAAADNAALAVLAAQQAAAAERADKSHRDPLAQFDNTSNLVANGANVPNGQTNGVTIGEVHINVTPTGDPVADRAAGAAAAQGFQDQLNARAHVRVNVGAS